MFCLCFVAYFVSCLAVSSLGLSVPFILVDYWSIHPSDQLCLKALPCQICVCESVFVCLLRPSAVLTVSLVRLKFFSGHVTLVWLLCKVRLVICVWTQLSFRSCQISPVSHAKHGRIYQKHRGSCEHLTEAKRAVLVWIWTVYNLFNLCWPGCVLVSSRDCRDWLQHPNEHAGMSDRQQKTDDWFINNYTFSHIICNGLCWSNTMNTKTSTILNDCHISCYPIVIPALPCIDNHMCFIRTQDVQLENKTPLCSSSPPIYTTPN